MRHFPFTRLLLLALLSLPLARAELPETDWLELMPPADRKALEEILDIIHDTPEAAGTLTSKGGLKQSDRKMPAVMYSAKTVASLDDKAIRLGGYPVPLENGAKGHVTEFFLAPYLGAYIHVPPPSPNQTVLVCYPQGLKPTDIYTPLWVSGMLKAEQVSNGLTDAAYAVDKAQVKVVEGADLQGRHLRNGPWRTT